MDEGAVCGSCASSPADAGAAGGVDAITGDALSKPGSDAQLDSVAPRRRPGLAAVGIPLAGPPEPATTARGDRLLKIATGKPRSSIGR